MSAFALRLIACLAMLADNIGYCYGIEILRIIGRMAFPLFVYLIYNGYRHSSHRWKYALRLGLFALISQVPFSLFCANKVLIENGNVFVTLLVCLLVVWGTDFAWKHKLICILSPIPALVGFGLYYFGILHSDYGPKGVLMIMVFYMFSGKQHWKRIATTVGVLISVFYARLLAVGFWCLYALQGKAYTMPAITRWEILQAFSLLALPLIFLYNGKKGGFKNKKRAKKIQYAFYLFYPVHMLVLWLLRIA